MYNEARANASVACGRTIYRLCTRTHVRTHAETYAGTLAATDERALKRYTSDRAKTRNVERSKRRSLQTALDLSLEFIYPSLLLSPSLLLPGGRVSLLADDRRVDDHRQDSSVGVGASVGVLNAKPSSSRRPRGKSEVPLSA